MKCPTEYSLVWLKILAVLVVSAGFINKSALAFDQDTNRDVQVSKSPSLESYVDSLNDVVPCGGKGRAAKHAMYLRLRGNSETDVHNRHDKDDADAPSIIHNAFKEKQPKTNSDIIMFTVRTNIECMKHLKMLP